MLLLTPDIHSGTFFGPRIRSKAALNSPFQMTSLKTHIVHLESQTTNTLWSIDLGQVFLAIESTEQVFGRRHDFRVYFGDLAHLRKVNTHPVRTIFLLNYDDE